MTVLETVGLTKRFGELVAVDDLSLQVREGEVFGFLGPNGAGKTTSISMMCGLLAPDAGHVLIKGQPIAAGSADIRAHVGVCPQQIVVWKELTCTEQLLFTSDMYDMPRKAAKSRTAMLLGDLGLTEKAHATAGTLSGGMQRRLNVALALVHDPSIVVLDEPEAGLDPQSRLVVREYIQSLAQHKTVIVTTHNMDEAERIADRVAIVDHGKLLVVDTPEALVKQIGSGDVLELTLAQDADIAQATAAVAELVTECSAVDHTLVLRAQAMVGRMPQILDALRQAGVPPREVRLRENTLEDVFITLTGRSLRS